MLCVLGCVFRTCFLHLVLFLLLFLFLFLPLLLSSLSLEPIDTSIAFLPLRLLSFPRFLSPGAAAGDRHFREATARDRDQRAIPQADPEHVQLPSGCGLHTGVSSGLWCVVCGG